jgi:hypothetical protein
MKHVVTKHTTPKGSHIYSDIVITHATPKGSYKIGDIIDAINI